LGAREDLADVLKVQGGDTAAFERIVLRWQGPLINLAYRFCRDRSRAEDLGPGGVYPYLSRAIHLASRCRFLDVAFFSGYELLSLRIKAYPRSYALAR